MQPSQEQIDKWHNNPNNWFGYFFYYNKEDQRVMVDKRNRWAGMTLNFANPKSYYLLFAGSCFLGFIIYMIDKNGH